MPAASTGGGGGAPLGKRGAWAGLQHRMGHEVPRYLKRSEALRRKVKTIRYRRLRGR